MGHSIAINRVIMNIDMIITSILCNEIRINKQKKEKKEWNRIYLVGSKLFFEAASVS
jgi:hypothetical protein